MSPPTKSRPSGWSALPGSWSGYSQHAVDTLPLPTRHLASAEVLRFRDRAFDRYYADPGDLDSIRRTFGAETVRQVQVMVSRRLERTYTRT